MSNTSAILHPVDYTSRDYLSLREDLIRVIQARIPDWAADNPADFGVALVEAFSYVGDILNYYIDRAAAETFLGTASQRQSLLNIASLLGYSPAGRTAAQVDLTFVNNSASITSVPAGGRVTTAIRTGDVNTPLTFEILANPDSADGSWPVQPGGRSAVVPAVEGVTVSGVVIGQSSGFAGQMFTIRDTPIINRSLEIAVGSAPGTAVPYTYVQNLYEATSIDRRFTYRTDDVGVTSVIFGDGVSGAVPPINQNIYATYRLGGGTVGNITPGQTFVPVNFSFPGSIGNQTKASGGTQEESDEQIREAAFTAFRTRNSAVTKRDFEDLSTSDNRIAKAKARGNSLGNIRVFVAPVSSGDQNMDPHPGFNAYNVINSKVSSGVATVTVSETPQFTSQTVRVSGMGAPYDGVATAYSGENNTITFTRPGGDVPLAVMGGVITLGELDTFAEARADIRENLQNRGVIGSIVTVEPYAFRDLKLEVEVGIKPEFRQSAALASVRSSLKTLFAYQNVPFNLTVRAQDIHAFLSNNVPEIAYATAKLYDGPSSNTAVETVIARADEVVRLMAHNTKVTPADADPGIVGA